MVDVVGTVDKRRYSRHPVRTHVRAVADEMQSEGETKDISASGAALSLGGTLHNEVFVELHIQGLGRIPGQVVRVREDEIAVKFSVDENEEKRIERALEKIDMKS